ncbi:hypothetical protein Rruber_01406 [Rhodococcus ruber]|uniref:hypothetical protein n=1 Tax=Rhodococcus ruber TaxID=1830 RepID=UPI00315CBAC5
MSDTAATSWLSDTAEALSQAVDATKTQAQIENLVDAKESLAGSLEEFRQIARADVVARSLGWPGRTPAADLLNDLTTARETLDPRPMRRLGRSLERYRTDVRTDLIEHWHQYASDRMGDVSDLQVLATTLGQVAELADLSRQVEEALGRLARTQRELPSERSLGLLHAAEAKLQELETALQPAAVRRFLSAVARGGAPVELLTDAVADWLRTHGAWSSFRIVAGGPASDANE